MLGSAVSSLSRAKKIGRPWSWKLPAFAPLHIIIFTVVQGPGSNGGRCEQVDPAGAHQRDPIFVSGFRIHWRRRKSASANQPVLETSFAPTESNRRSSTSGKGNADSTNRRSSTSGNGNADRWQEETGFNNLIIVANTSWCTGLIYVPVLHVGSPYGKMTINICMLFAVFLEQRWFPVKTFKN